MPGAQNFDILIYCYIQLHKLAIYLFTCVKYIRDYIQQIQTYIYIYILIITCPKPESSLWIYIYIYLCIYSWYSCITYTLISYSWYILYHELSYIIYPYIIYYHMSYLSYTFTYHIYLYISYSIKYHIIYYVSGIPVLHLHGCHVMPWTPGPWHTCWVAVCDPFAHRKHCGTRVPAPTPGRGGKRRLTRTLRSDWIIWRWCKRYLFIRIHLNIFMMYFYV